MIYFDNAATTFPKPVRVLHALEQGLVKYGGNPGRSGHRMALTVGQKIFDVRSKVANLFHVDEESVVFTLNCTHALNLAIKGVLARGDHCIISCVEHNSVLRPVHTLQTRGEITYSVARLHPGDDAATVQSFAALIRPNTKAIICTHASNVTGDVLPIAELAALCKQRGLRLIVDAAQSAGVLDIDVKGLGIDYLCAPGHKGLYGATGTGILLVNHPQPLQTLIEGGSGGQSLYPLQPDSLPERLEAGTVNTVGILSLGAGIDFIKKHTLQQIYAHEMRLCQLFARRIRNNPNVVLYAQSETARKVPIVSFNLKGVDSSTATYRLSDNGFALRGGFQCSALAHRYLGTDQIGTIRFSPGFFNTDAQVEQFAKVVNRYANA